MKKVIFGVFSLLITFSILLLKPVNAETETIHNNIDIAILGFDEDFWFPDVPLPPECQNVEHNAQIRYQRCIDSGRDNCLQICKNAIPLENDTDNMAGLLKNKTSSPGVFADLPNCKTLRLT